MIEKFRERFEKNMSRHAGLSWADAAALLEPHWDAIAHMEASGGEPDVVRWRSGQHSVVDCSAESPTGRRSCCYDREGLESRKDHPPKTTAIDMAAEMGVRLLAEGEYIELQMHGEFDLKTSSWLQSEAEMRVLGGAIFGDRRFGRVFIYHNGAQSYYGARGFRAAIDLD
ncbi:MAG: DUF4256 domain-containing protein [Chthonomonas sp.]|nr:DUF4256 domain-containing protein [Chthonomonas sp.]